MSPLTQILPYIQQPFGIVKQYISPADPSVDVSNPTLTYCSYPYNYCVFPYNQSLYLSSSVTDGTSYTIAFAEHYAKCGIITFIYEHLPFTATERESIFADGVKPKTIGSPPVSRADYPGQTFQVQPCPGTAAACGSRPSCHDGLAQTPHASGMLAAMCDGHVRTLAPGMSETTYWAAVTPAANDSLGADW
jgi:prepilin-type processing-associated H-X9-DG protein